MVTSGSVSGGLLADGEAVPLSFGGSSRPPVLPPSRPSPVEPADWLGLLEWLPSEEPLPVLGAVEPRPEPDLPLDAVPEPCRLPSPPPWAGDGGSRDCSGATS